MKLSLRKGVIAAVWIFCFWATEVYSERPNFHGLTWVEMEGFKQIAELGHLPKNTYFHAIKPWQGLHSETVVFEYPFSVEKFTPTGPSGNSPFINKSNYPLPLNDATAVHCLDPKTGKLTKLPGKPGEFLEHIEIVEYLDEDGYRVVKVRPKLVSGSMPANSNSPSAQCKLRALLRARMESAGAKTAGFSKAAGKFALLAAAQGMVNESIVNGYNPHDEQPLIDAYKRILSAGVVSVGQSIESPIFGGGLGESEDQELARLREIDRRVREFGNDRKRLQQLISLFEQIEDQRAQHERKWRCGGLRSREEYLRWNTFTDLRDPFTGASAAQVRDALESGGLRWNGRMLDHAYQFIEGQRSAP